MDGLTLVLLGLSGLSIGVGVWKLILGYREYRRDLRSLQAYNRQVEAYYQRSQAVDPHFIVPDHDTTQ